MNYLGACFFIILVSVGCSSKPSEAQLSSWKDEIRATEKAFSDLAQTAGIPKAFSTYAAPDAVILRNDRLIKGISDIEKHLNATENSSSNSLTWSPEFVEVSNSGDLGYTYGNYIYTTVDALGNTKVYKGIFHTVWKRQKDGKWRFVWD